MLFSEVFNFVCSRRSKSVDQSVSGLEHVEDSSAAWFEAVENDDLEIVQDMMKKGFPVDAVDKLRWSALHIAVWNGYSTLCDTLVQNNADPNLKGPGGITPLFLACHCGHADIVKLLLNAGCNVQSVADLEGNCQVTGLHIASCNGHTAAVQALIEGGADVSSSMSTGTLTGITALHLAVEGGHMETIEVLLNAGCDVNMGTVSVIETIS